MWQVKKLPFFIDIIFCLVLLPAMIALLPIERWLINNSLFVYLLIAWLYIVYVLNRHIIMPRVFSKKHIGLIVILFLLTMLGTYLITCYQMEIPLHKVRRPKTIIHNIPKIRLQQQAVWFLYVVVTAFSIAVGLLTELYRQVTQKQIIAFEKKKAELALYKAQINPHFLFNSLNTLYALVVTKSSKAENAFMQFIDLMKYMYTNNVKDKIPVYTEIEYIQQYIELQKFRMPENFHIHFSYEHDDTDKLDITPMILITFIENMFKHGVSSHIPGDAYIIIRAENGELLFSTNNPLLNHKQNHQSKGKGIGIDNCRKRLDLLYPNKYSLFTGEREQQYIVTLSINLK